MKRFLLLMAFCALAIAATAQNIQTNFWLRTDCIL